jgi:hypothetical protein
MHQHSQTRVGYRRQHLIRSRIPEVTMVIERGAQLDAYETACREPSDLLDRCARILHGQDSHRQESIRRASDFGDRVIHRPAPRGRRPGVSPVREQHRQRGEDLTPDLELIHSRQARPHIEVRVVNDAENVTTLHDARFGVAEERWPPAVTGASSEWWKVSGVEVGMKVDR